MTSLPFTDDLVTEAMEEDVSSELPCTLAIEDSVQDTTESIKEDQVSFFCYSYARPEDQRDCI